MNKKLVAPLIAALGLGAALVAPATQAHAITCAQVGYRVYAGDGYYAPELDRNKDGVGCEAYPERPGTSASTPSTNLWCSQITRRDIPVGDPQYTRDRDRDDDGIACESGGDDGAISTATGTRSATPKPSRTAKPAATATPSAKSGKGGLAKTGR